VQVNTPAGATQIRDFEINRRTGCFYLADRLSGFWTSCDKGTTGLSETRADRHHHGLDVVLRPPRDQVIYGTYSVSGSTTAFYRTSDDGQHWTPITLPSTTTTGWPTYTGGTFAPDGELLVGFTHGNAGSGGTAYSSNGTSFTQSVVPANATCTAPGGAWGPYSRMPSITTYGWEPSSAAFTSRLTTATTSRSCSVAEVGFPGGIRVGNAESVAVDRRGQHLCGGAGRTVEVGAGRCPLTWTQYVCKQQHVGRALGVYRQPRRDLLRPQERHQCAPTRQVNGGTTPLYQSLDGGATWTAFSTGLPTPARAVAEIESPFDHQLYVYLQDPSTDAGSVWVTVQANGTLAPYGWQNEFSPPAIVNERQDLAVSLHVQHGLSQTFQTQVSS
jgi:hypothetical protein